MKALLETARLLLCRPVAEDTPDLERVFCDPGMMRYLGAPWAPSYVTEVRMEWQTDWGAGQRWTGVVKKRTTLEFVGIAGLTRDTLPGEAGYEVSWFVLPEHQNQGLATELTLALLQLAFTRLGAERVVAATHPANPASNRVLAKLGFARLGERHDTYADLPGFDTQVVWALTRAVGLHQGSFPPQKD